MITNNNSIKYLFMLAAFYSYNFCKIFVFFLSVGINEHLKKEDYCELKIIMRKYGEFKQFANKKNSFLILPENV